MININKSKKDFFLINDQNIFFGETPYEKYKKIEKI